MYYGIGRMAGYPDLKYSIFLLDTHGGLDITLQLTILFITDVWREYIQYEGLDITLQLVIPSGDVSPTTAPPLVDNNVTSCMNTDLCLNSGNVYTDSFSLIFLSINLSQYISI